MSQKQIVRTCLEKQPNMTIDELMEATGLTKQQIYNVRTQLKKQGVKMRNHAPYLGAGQQKSQKSQQSQSNGETQPTFGTLSFAVPAGEVNITAKGVTINESEVSWETIEKLATSELR